MHKAEAVLKSSVDFFRVDEKSVVVVDSLYYNCTMVFVIVWTRWVPPRTLHSTSHHHGRKTSNEYSSRNDISAVLQMAEHIESKNRSK